MSVQTNPQGALAVLDAAVAQLGCAAAVDLKEARTSIAELLEAAREASAILGHIYHTTPLRPDLEKYAHDGYQRLDAAIGAVSPPKARKYCDHSWAVKVVTGGPVRVCQNCGFVPKDGAIAHVGGGK